ncbi:MAG TPA: IclR family transcriptional regulator [Mycobacterium sp.]|jgi:DNA-binding IclR family transcriptional regulator|nr:IclR family transcriptional regulator [Mycobacterium sp.]
MGDVERKPTGKTEAAVQSVDRALLVLEILATLGHAGVTEIAAELGVHKSTVSRLIAVLESRGYVEQATERGKYRLGFTISRLARASSGHLDLVKLSQDVCDMLAPEVGETTNLAILDEDRIVNIVETIGPEQISLRTWVGQSCPAHATSSGKVLLAGLDAQDLRARLAATLESFTANTVVTLADLERELAGVRERGWACVVEELEVGLNAVSAPIYDAGSNVIAALSVSGPAYRLSPDRFPEIAKQTTAAAEVISRRLGWVERDRG